MYIFQNLRLWLRKGESFWYFIIPLLLTIILFFLLRPCQQWGLSLFRIFGIACEFLGLWIVFRSLSEEIKNYGLKGYAHQFVQLVKCLRSIFSKREGVVATITGASTTAMTGNIRARIVNIPTTTDEKIEYILDELKRIEAITNTTEENLRLSTSILENKIEEIKNQTQNSLHNLGRRLEEKATGEYYFLTSGLLLTALGILLTNMPDKIFALLGFSIG